MISFYCLFLFLLYWAAITSLDNFSGRYIIFPVMFLVEMLLCQALHGFPGVCFGFIYSHYIK